MRGLHRLAGRRGDAVLPDPGSRCRRRRDHHHRRAGHPRRAACGAGGMGGRAGGAMRLLPVGPDHAGRRPAGADPEPERCRDRRGDGG
ncbi:UNVERIFIED_CONTAM: hypothetical protein NCL1_16493 [Trichonephila clavipes]